MKEIKYRAWKREDNRWADHNEQLGDVGVGASVSSPSILKIETDIYDVQMFTGLHDKNGKDIYEGDEYQNPQGKVFIIEYETKNAQFVGVHRDSGSIVDLNSDDGTLKGEVIGNIYEEEVK